MFSWTHGTEHKTFTTLADLAAHASVALQRRIDELHPQWVAAYRANNHTDEYVLAGNLGGLRGLKSSLNPGTPFAVAHPAAWHAEAYRLLVTNGNHIFAHNWRGNHPVTGVAA